MPKRARVALLTLFAGSIKYLSDGRTYSGWWRSNRKNGPGVMMHANGTRQNGMWKDDVYQGPMEVDSEHSSKTNPQRK
jgi:hypothetical protein